jgi:casein kinase I family protein HRR25
MIIANKYKIIEKLNNGEFGTIFKAENIRTKEKVAIKMESISLEKGINMLKRETQIYQYLGKGQGIPQVKWFGTTDEYNYMVLPLFGDSLASKTFSLIDSFSIGKKIVKILSFIHGKGLIHRDIKPDNFVFSQDQIDIYIIDFGLCRKFIDNSNEHIEMKSGKTIIGTPNFVSVNVHNGIEPSRRDDLISVAYIILYLINGGLPWLGLERGREMKEMKMQKQCILQWSKTPLDLMAYIEYCENLKFDETPDYEYLIKSLNEI